MSGLLAKLHAIEKGEGDDLMARMNLIIRIVDEAADKQIAKFETLDLVKDWVHFGKFVSDYAHLWPAQDSRKETA